MAKKKTNWLSYCGSALGIALGITIAAILSNAFGWGDYSFLRILLQIVLTIILFVPLRLLFDRIAEKRNRKKR